MIAIKRLGIKRKNSSCFVTCFIILIVLYITTERQQMFPGDFYINCPQQHGNFSKREFKEPNYNVPVDLVYLWVNGSDPKFILELKRQKALGDIENYSSFLRCRRRSDNERRFRVIVVYPVLYSTKHLSENENIDLIFNVTERDLEYTVIVPKQTNKVKDIMSTLTMIEGRAYISTCGYITPEIIVGKGRILENMYIVTVKSRDASSRKSNKPVIRISKNLKNVDSISKEDIQNGKITSVLVYGQLNGDNQFFDKTITKLKGYDLEINPAVLVWSTDSIVIDGLPPSKRFADNHQLKYSLRSVEKYAPWIHHIYIITNDQTPSWLNTSNERISVISTKEIFPNPNDLPTFSSPAIESHMYRIPGLSETFIFMCDDFFFGKPVTLSDFYTKEDGLKINWGRQLDLCSFRCSHMLLGNGKCDSACDNLRCGWDQGDCGPFTQQRLKQKYPKALFSGSLYRTMAMFNRCSLKSTDSLYYHEPQHSPLLVNRQIALDLENTFHEEFKKSSAFHFRSQFNVQYTMAYLLFVSSSRVVMTTDTVFDDMDYDKSGTVSIDEEMEFMTSKGVPKWSMKYLTESTLQCSDLKTSRTGQKDQISKLTFTQCPGVKDFISWAGISKARYKHTQKSEDNLHFITITNQRGKSKGKFSKLTMEPRKFNAINDDIDYSKRESVILQDMLQTIYKKLFPIPSQFELRGL